MTETFTETKITSGSRLNILATKFVQDNQINFQNNPEALRTFNNFISLMIDESREIHKEEKKIKKEKMKDAIKQMGNSTLLERNILFFILEHATKATVVYETALRLKSDSLAEFEELCEILCRKGKKESSSKFWDNIEDAIIAAIIKLNNDPVICQEAWLFVCSQEECLSTRKDFMNSIKGLLRKKAESNKTPTPIPITEI